MRLLWNVVKTLIFIPGVAVWIYAIREVVQEEKEPEPIVRPIMYSK